MAGRRVHFVLPEELLARIDAALPDGVSRGFWVRRALERALNGGAADETSPRAAVDSSTGAASVRASGAPVSVEPEPEVEREPSAGSLPRIARRHWAS